MSKAHIDKVIEIVRPAGQTIMDVYALFIIWLLMLSCFVALGLRRFWKERSIQGVYGLSALAGFMLIGFVIRAYQVFPVWGMSSLMLAVYIVWLSSKCNATDNQKEVI
jgi:Kef-type K+ transport system membrane component KefB